MQFQFFVGIDISKLTLDITVLEQNQKCCYHQIENNKKSINAWLKSIVKEFKINSGNTLFCMEHTGLYNEFLLACLSQKKLSIWLETSINIKHSIGMQRGKNDQLDSQRIAEYAYLKRDSARLWQAPRGIIRELQVLSRVRTRLINSIKQLSTSMKEDALFLSKRISSDANKMVSHSTKALKKDLEGINKKIETIIADDPYLSVLFKRITSVEGVGKVTATEMIICTNEFKKFSDAKKFACYSGIAPFEHRSGTSVRGKTRVSHMANKKMKTLLHMCALSAREMKGEMKDYFDRKVAEGKNKMSVINAIRNKIIHRIFACINEQRCYQKKLSQSLV